MCSQLPRPLASPSFGMSLDCCYAMSLAVFTAVLLFGFSWGRAYGTGRFAGYVPRD